MASASTLITNPAVSKTYDFASADVFCHSYCDEVSQNDTNNANGVVSDSSIKDFQKSRMARSYSPTAVYDHPNESLYQETISVMESSMKRHTDDIMRFLEGISSRLSHLELYCYNVDKSVGEMRSNLSRDYEETDSKLTSLEKKLIEVGRSVQILRDKQDLAETQKELAKLQLAQRKLSSPNAPQHILEQSPSPTSDASEVEKQHLAIIIRQQGTQPYSPSVRPVEVPVPRPVTPLQNTPQHVMNHQHYYLTSAQGQYLTSDSQYRSSQSIQQDMNLVRLRPVSAQVSHQASPPLVHRFIQYPQSTQQPQSQLMYPSTHLSTQQPPTPVQRLPNSASSHLLHQPSQYPQQPQEAVPVSVHMTTPLPDMPSQVVSNVDVLPNRYVQRRPQPQLLTQQIKASYGSPLGNGYASMGPHQSLSTGAYMMYKNEDAMRQFPHQSQGTYPQTNVPAQHSQHASPVRNQTQPQFACNHPYTDIPEKCKMEEGGQAVDFNAVVDTPNAQQSFGFQRGWTG